MSERGVPRALNQLGADFSAALVRDRRKRDRRRRVITVATAAAVLIVAIATFGLFDRESISTPEAAAKTLADTSLGIDPPPVGRYAYTEARIASASRVRIADLGDLKAPPPLTTVRQQAWLERGGSGVIRSQPLGGGAAPSTSIRASSVRIGSSKFTPEDLLAPGAAKSVARSVRAVPEEATNGRAAMTRWRAALSPLEAAAPVLPPEVRAALIRELGAIPGVKLDPAASDGERVFVLKADGLLSEATFNSATATMVGTSTTTARRGAGPFRDASAGTLLYRYTLLAAREVSRVGQTR